MSLSNCDEDLAGRLYPHPNWLQTRLRIDRLIDRYLSLPHLSDRFADLPQQFNHPQPRAWQPICWQNIHRSQIVGLNVEIFLAVLVGAMTVESPIRGYSEVSWQYLNRFHQPMAGFVGGKWAEDGSILELGMWEKEERQHSPALAKIYKELTGESLTAKPTRVKPYQPSECPYQDMYRHGLHRVVTEYGATCLYLWLVAHSTNALQQVLVEILLDEINHMTKFFGFGIWAFAESSGDRLKSSLSKILTSYSQPRSQVDRSTKRIPNPSVELYHTFGRVMELVDWQTWHPISKLELTYTFLRVMHRLWRWRSTLTPEYLQGLLGTPPCGQDI